MATGSRPAGARPPLGVLMLSGIRHASYLAPCFAANPDCRLVAVADAPDVPERWRDAGPALAARFGIPFLEDVDAALARPDVEAVCVASEYVRHGQLALKVLEAGKHLLLDKPMATSLEECRTVAAAAARVEDTGVKTMTFSRFTAPSVQRARQAIRAGWIGRVRALRAEYVATYGPGEAYDPATDVNWLPRYTGGGEILNFALYPLTNVRMLSGLEIEAVQCFGGALFNRAHRELGIEDVATIVLRLAGGAVATILVGRGHAPNHPTRGDVRARVIGTAGVVEADESGPALAVYGVPSVGVAARSLEGQDVLIQDVIDRFVRWVREGIPPGQTVVDSLRVMEASFAAEESLRTGKVVAVGGRLA
jgi:predicted dehydrogenase